MNKLHSGNAATAAEDNLGLEPSGRALEPSGRDGVILPFRQLRDVVGAPSAPSDPKVPSSPRRSPWRAVKEIISIIAGVTLALVAVLAILVAVSTRLSGDGQLGILGHPVMTVLSGSMAPVIKTGDLVVDDRLTPAQAANLHKGQIISFRASAGSAQIFTHRIAGVEPLPGGVVGYVTKGDANDSRDGPVTPSTNVVGLYQSKIPAGGFILNALHKPLVLGLILASPILWLLSEPLWRWAREAEESPDPEATEGGESAS